MVAALGVGYWAYTTRFSPDARQLAQDLQQTDQWVRCVLAQPAQNVSTCGQMTRARLNNWFEHGRMDMLANGQVRTKLERLTIQ